MGILSRRAYFILTSCILLPEGLLQGGLTVLLLLLIAFSRSLIVNAQRTSPESDIIFNICSPFIVSNLS